MQHGSGHSTYGNRSFAPSRRSRDRRIRLLPEVRIRVEHVQNIFQRQREWIHDRKVRERQQWMDTEWKQWIQSNGWTTKLDLVITPGHREII